MAEASPMPMCPMAETCKSMMEKPFSGVALIAAGILFIALGILIVFEPRIVIWILAIAFVLVGLMILMMAGFIRRIGARFQSLNSPAA